MVAPCLPDLDPRGSDRVLQVELGWVMIWLAVRSWRMLMRLMGVAGAALLLAAAGCGGTHRTVVQVKAHSGSSAKSHQSGNGTRANRFPRRYLLGLAMARRPLACPPNEARLNARSLLGLGVDATRRRVEGYGCTARVVILNGRGLAIFDDLRTNRVDLVVNHGIVTGVAVG